MQLDHIAIAVESIDKAIEIYSHVYGLEPDHIERIDSEHVLEAMIPLGETHIQLLEATDTDSTVSKFIERRGPGLHHIALLVEDIEAAIARIKAEGGEVLDEKPRPGASGSQVAFVHPHTTAGVLVELVQR